MEFILQRKLLNLINKLQENKDLTNKLSLNAIENVKEKFYLLNFRERI